MQGPTKTQVQVFFFRTLVALNGGKKALFVVKGDNDTNPYLAAETLDVAEALSRSLRLENSYEVVRAEEVLADGSGTYADFSSRKVLILRSHDDVEEFATHPVTFPYSARSVQLNQRS